MKHMLSSRTARFISPNLNKTPKSFTKKELFSLKMEMEGEGNEKGRRKEGEGKEKGRRRKCILITA